MRRLLGDNGCKRHKNAELSLPRMKAAEGIRSFSADGRISHKEFRLTRDEHGKVRWRQSEKKRTSTSEFLHPLVDMEQIYSAIQDLTDDYEEKRMLNSMHMYLMESVKIYGESITIRLSVVPFSMTAYALHSFSCRN